AEVAGRLPADPARRGLPRRPVRPPSRSRPPRRAVATGSHDRDPRGYPARHGVGAPLGIGLPRRDGSVSHAIGGRATPLSGRAGTARLKGGGAPVSATPDASSRCQFELEMTPGFDPHGIGALPSSPASAVFDPHVAGATWTWWIFSPMRV